jgi:RNA polymerase sigma-70 factor, ECF subfamily
MTDSAPRPRLAVLAGGESPATEHPLRAAFHAHHRAVYATAHRILADPAEAEDVTQTVFETLARALSRDDALRDPARLGAYLKSCAVRECLMLLRRQRWWHGPRGARARATDAIAVDDAFLVAAVRELLDALSPEERAAVVLKLVEQHSHEEVAEIMGTSVATARRRLASARRSMIARAGDELQHRLVAELEDVP